MNLRIFILPSLLLTALVLGGCQSRPVQEGGETGGKIATTQPSTSKDSDVRTTGLPDRSLPPDFSDPRSPLYQRVIYFDYDRSDLSPDSVEILRAHALYLSTHPNRKIRLEGHADERGTREYNLALSEQRALGVRRFLLAEGVGLEQLSVLSYGEERPAQRGHDEAAWAANRRVELVYL